jgi:hypothetical protein
LCFNIYSEHMLHNKLDPILFIEFVSIACACRFPLGFVCSIFPLGLLIRSARPLSPGQIFRGAVADLLSLVPALRPGFSQPSWFSSCSWFWFSVLLLCERVFYALVFLSAVCLCLARWENLSRQLFYLAIVFCCVAVGSLSAWWIPITNQRSSLSLFSGFLFSLQEQCLPCWFAKACQLFEFICAVIWIIAGESRYCSWAVGSRARTFQVLVILLRWFLSYAHQVFSKICVRAWVAYIFNFVCWNLARDHASIDCCFSLCF